MENLVAKAEDAGWTYVGGGREHLSLPYGAGAAPGTMITLERDAERIQIEVGSGGIPRKIWRTDPDGNTTAISQNYIDMGEVLGWLERRDD